MERERIKEIARRITNALLECDDFTYEDMACAISHLVSVMDSLYENANNTTSVSFAKYVYEMIGYVYKVSSDKPTWRASTEHPAIDEDVIVLIDDLNIGSNYKIAFGHIVDKERCIDYNGWNIPNVVCWMPCPKIPYEKED